jgi:hypothetical protein
MHNYNMTKRKFKFMWINSLKIGDLVGVRTPCWPLKGEKIILSSALIVLINKNAETVQLLYPNSGQVVNCHFKQIFPIKKLKSLTKD